MLLIRRAGDKTWHTPQVTAYSDEQALESLLEQSPDLLPGANRETMVVARQLEVPGVGYADMVGIDATGAVTLVECKLKANPEIRRAIVGQVFAYASGLWRLSYEDFDRLFEARTGASLIEQVSALGVDSWDEERFRAAVAANLADGTFRLVIAVDAITDELKRTVIFLNEHTVSNLQVLALELGYIADEGVEIVVPVVYGEESVQTKVSSSRKLWNEESLFSALNQYCSPAGVQAVEHLYSFAEQHGAGFSWGQGSSPAVAARFQVSGAVVSVWVCYAYEPSPVLEIGFRYMQGRVPTEGSDSRS